MSTSFRVVTVMTRASFQDPDTTASRASFRVIAVTVHTVLTYRGWSESSLGVGQTSFVRSRLSERLPDVAAAIVLGAWFLGALWIVTDWMHVEARRSNLWILMLVFMGPVLALAAAEELVDWMRNGRRPPGRHRRDPGATHETD